jgi:hypothetical protein
MMIMILDQGIGIPKRLEPTIFEQVKAIMRLTMAPSDGNMISAATELWRTSTGQGGRGRGFQDMKRFIDTCDDGELRVFSNRGAYTYMKDAAASVADFKDSMGGTLVQWRVRHAEKVEVSDD